MSTQFDTSIVDLDRTDQLPVLDVEAYEASLAADSKSLSSTDTWAVQALRAVDEPEAKSADVVASFTVAKPNVQAEALTTNVEQILKRIAELEAEIVATHAANATLQEDCAALRAERDQEKLRIAVVTADNAALCEERAQSDQTRGRLEQQLQARDESIAALEKSISNEKNTALQMSRQLAAKLLDYEKAISTVELRDSTIEDLTRNGADLNQRLQQEIANSAEVVARLASVEQSLGQSRAQLLEREDVIGRKDAQLLQAHAQIQGLTEERDSLLSISVRLDKSAIELDARAAQIEQKNVELAQLRDELVAALAQAQSQGKLLNERTDELGKLRDQCTAHEAALHGFEHAMRMRDEQAEDLRTQLQVARDERAMMAVQIDKARARVKNLTDQVFSRDNRIATLQADLAVHAEALATIRRDVNRINGRGGVESDKVEYMLEPIGHEGPTLNLIGEILTVGRTSDNDISIPSKLISRCHARLLVGPTGVIIEDANSMNGCYVNGEQVRQHLLHEGDVLELGDMSYRLRTTAARDTRSHEAKLRQLPSAPRSPRGRGQAAKSEVTTATLD